MEEEEEEEEEEDVEEEEKEADMDGEEVEEEVDVGEVEEAHLGDPCYPEGGGGGGGPLGEVGHRVLPAVVQGLAGGQFLFVCLLLFFLRDG